MKDERLTEEELMDILNELKTSVGTIYDVYKKTSNQNTKDWITEWRRYCDNSSDIEDYYPPTLTNL